MQYDLKITLWSGPVCPSCGYGLWLHMTLKDGLVQMVCKNCKKICGPEIKHAHKRFTPEELYDTISKGD